LQRVEHGRSGRGKDPDARRNQSHDCKGGAEWSGRKKKNRGGSDTSPEGSGENGRSEKGAEDNFGKKQQKGAKGGNIDAETRLRLTRNFEKSKKLSLIGARRRTGAKSHCAKRANSAIILGYKKPETKRGWGERSPGRKGKPR